VGYLLVRVFLREGDRIGGKPAEVWLLEFLKAKGISGATVLKSIMGYGTTGEFHYEGIEVLSYGLPLVVEFVEEEDKINRMLEEVVKNCKGLITLEEVSLWQC
jgi:hypothetical protein